MTTLFEDLQWISEAAYFKALAREFTPKDDYKDWLEAKTDYETQVLPHRKNALVVIKAD